MFQQSWFECWECWRANNMAC